MTEWTSASVSDALGIAPPPSRAFRQISTDTRTLAPGDLFVALAGARFDGHRFLEAARDAGATGAVVRHGTGPVEGLVLFAVDDPLRALGRLASRRRHEIDGPVVGITGTSGKTSTKELAARVMGVRWTVHATGGNLNNQIGVPLTLLSAPKAARALVVEAGASVPGEIARLRAIIDPTCAVVTNVTAGHVEGFGSREAILEEKLALVEQVPLAIVGLEPSALASGARERAERVLTAGLDATADVHPDRWSLDDAGCPVLTFRGRTMRIPLVGKHQGENGMLALALAEVLDIDLAAVAQAIETAALPGGRCEVVRSGNLIVLNDAYNANPASFAAALETARHLRNARPFIVLAGSMLELGEETAAAHADVAAAILAEEPAVIGAVGEFVAAFEPHRAGLGDRLVTAGDAEAVGRALARRLRGNEFILVKGSRGMRLECALPFLLPDREAQCSTTS